MQPKCIKNGKPCEIHKDGKFTHWSCGIYDPQKRHEQFIKRKSICGECGKEISTYAKLCRKCNSKIYSAKRKGIKLPTWWRKNISDGQKGNKSSKWKGDSVNYSALHKWLRKNLNSPKYCSFCGKENYKNGRREYLEYANVSGLYKRNFEDWIPLCPKCHTKFDKDKPKRTFYKDGQMYIKT